MGFRRDFDNGIAGGATCVGESGECNAGAIVRVDLSVLHERKAKERLTISLLTEALLYLPR